MGTAVPLAWGGIYETTAGPLGGLFSPIVFFGDGTMTVGGENKVVLSKDIATSLYSFQDTNTFWKDPPIERLIRGTMQFRYGPTLGLVQQGGNEFAGTIVPAAGAQPIAWTGQQMFGIGADGRLGGGLALAVPSADHLLISKAVDEVSRRLQSTRDADPLLAQLRDEPANTLIAFGVPASAFAGPVGGELTALLSAHARRDLSNKREPHYWRCWACRIGFGCVFAVAGVVLAAATGGLATTAYAGAIAYASYVFGAAAKIAVNALVAAGAFAGAGGLGIVIDLICDAIPDTCS